MSVLPALDVIELLRPKSADVRHPDPCAPIIRHNGCELVGETGLDVCWLRPIARRRPIIRAMIGRPSGDGWG